MPDTPHILIATPRMRLYGRALESAYRMRRAYGRSVDTLELQNDQPYAEGNRNVLHLYQRLRTACLAGPWTHMLTLEDDMVVPEDALDRLLAADAPVAYALYCWRWGSNQEHLWNAYVRVYEDSGMSWAQDQPHTVARWARERRVIDVAGLGLGCTLIRRDVLEAVPFRLPARAPAANDWYFALDLQAAGIRQVCDLGVVCGHIRDDPSRRIIWPNLDATHRPAIAWYEVLDTTER